MIFLLAALTAFASFIHEVNLSQTLSGALGGTVLRYHTGFGLFTFFLGLGAWSFDVLSKRYSSRHILLAAQALLIVCGLGGPLWIQVFNPLFFPQDFEFIFTLACYIPLIAVAFVSGVELPALMKSSSQDFSVLGFDYVGMFLACLAYPLYFLYNWGVSGTAVFASLINLVVLIYFATKKSNTKKINNKPSSTEGSWVFIGLLIFLFSFCSMAYELLIAKMVSDFLLDEVLGHSVSIGVFLLGLGLGTFQADKIKKHLKALITVEAAITLFAILAVVVFTALATLLTLTPWQNFTSHHRLWGLLTVSPLILLLGYLSGFELPLLLRLSGRSENSLGFLLSLNYTGALFAGFIVPLLILPLLAINGGFVVMAGLNLLGLGLLILKTKNKLRLVSVSLFVGLGLLLTQAGAWNYASEQMFLKAFYLKLKVSHWSLTSFKTLKGIYESTPTIWRKTSTYQFIDIFNEEGASSLYQKHRFTLFLNRKLQFSSLAFHTYHETFSRGAENLAGTLPDSLLILGGGDGLLAAELLKWPHIKKIVVVELDPAMIELAKTHPKILSLNNNAFADSRVEVVIDDAFRFLHQHKQKYSAVFVDFPYPNSFELSRLYSVEFYRSLQGALAPNGFIIMDAPIAGPEDSQSDKNSHQIISDTLLAAGFNSVFAFGPVEPFIFATTEKRSIAFNYDVLPETIRNRTFVNLNSLEFLNKKHESPLVNSVYHPLRFHK